jgi:hypothetical protein
LLASLPFFPNLELGDLPEAALAEKYGLREA